MTPSIKIDSATGTIFDAIGSILTKNGKEDASGARRAIASSLENGDVGLAAAWMGCSETEAQALKAEFLA